MESPRPIGLMDSSGSVPALRQLNQRLVDAPVDLDALARETRALAIGALARYADLVDAFLSRRRLDCGNLRGQRTPIVRQRNEQIGPERDEEIPAALPVGRHAGKHAERVRR